MKNNCRICRYFWNNLIAVDQLVNTIFGGDPDETISSRMGKWGIHYKDDHNNWRHKFAKGLCWLLNLIDKDHCNKSIESDEGNKEVIE